MQEVRRLIGVCPQHNVLFLTLTVAENLDFFGALRGVPDEDRYQRVMQKIAQVGLTEKVHTKAG